MVLYILLLLLFVVFIQDFKTRRIYSMLLPIIFLTSIAYRWKTFDLHQVLLCNLYILILLISLTLYLSFKNKRFTLVWKGYLGLGDILFLVAVTPLFHVLEYIYFLTFSLLIIIILYLLSIVFIKRKTIPLAGYLSVILSIYLLLNFDITQLFTKIDF